MDNYLSIPDIQKVLGVTYGTVNNWLISGKLKGCKAGKLWRVRESDLNEFLKVKQDKE